MEYATEQEAKDVVLNSEHFQNRGNKIHLFLLSDLPPFEDPTKDEVLPFKRGRYGFIIPSKVLEFFSTGWVMVCAHENLENAGILQNFFH